ncbi:MAG: NADH-ubiquinone oxidoreductase-F iron-sulfur binding region domain-containing protein [Bacillota bacterium]|jgi:NADH-quinone oxidoreductase subunit F
MRFLLGYGSCGLAAGAAAVEESLREVLAGSDAVLQKVGCNGMCFAEPLLQYIDDEGHATYYGRLNAKSAAKIAREILAGQTPTNNLLNEEDLAFINKQTRIALANCGNIDPQDINSYIEVGGYEALKEALKKDPLQIIEQMKVSGLRGRGGAGFPTWMKWQAAKDAPGEQKFVICNADEGDPGAFMDRSILEGDPHGVLEGMILAAYAIGSSEGIIYVRAEYPLAVKRLQIAIDQANKAGFLGENICNSGFSFNIRLFKGAGAFVCGEETALMASLSGERGMPYPKPPYPVHKGYQKMPTSINNVETFANVPWIIRNGGTAFAAMGTEDSKGTKVFALAGKVKRGGLVEVPMGMTLRQLIFDIAGGIKNDIPFKGVQMGGPSGGCLPAELLDTPIEYKSLSATGAIMGSGGMIVMDEATCMVEMARFFMNFVSDESCGRCLPCRTGTKRMLEILNRIVEGKALASDLQDLSELAQFVRTASLCALGGTAPNPVLTTLKYFADEYKDHIENKHCAAKKCQALLLYRIDEDKCQGCTLCVSACPTKSISGELKKAHFLDAEKCSKCGECLERCPFGAIEVLSGKDREVLS